MQLVGRMLVVCLLLSGYTLATTEDFHEAVEHGSLPTVRRIIEARPDAVEERAPDGSVPLHLAAANGQAAMAKLLLHEGAEVNAETRRGRTALELALEGGHRDVAEVLLAAGAQVSPRAVNELLWEGEFELAELVGAHAESLDIVAAAALGDVGRVSELLEADPSLLETTGRPFGDTPLHWAAARGQADAVRLLVEEGANPRAGRYGTPLHWAAAMGRLEATRLLLRAGASANENDSLLATPLHCAAAGGNKETILALLSGGAMVDGAEGNTEASQLPPWGTPLHWAAGMGRAQAADVLIAAGADVNAPAAYFATPLHVLHHEDYRGAPGLMARVARDLGLAPAPLMVVLVWPSKEGGAERLDSFHMRRSVLTYRAESALTPLHWAAHMGEEAVAELLLAKGADPNAADELFGAPLHWAAGGGHPDTVRLLLREGARLNVTTAFFGRPLHWAARTGQTSVTDLLLRADDDVSSRDPNGNTALHLAARYGHAGLASFLLQAGAPYDAANKRGKTPLQVAMEEGHDEVAELLEGGSVR
ncbi:MAG: ankyrin repeat domain-containing protein [Candidatus Brocadiia bacterium]